MNKKKVLILGGTNFIGRNLVETLIQRDEYDLTLFNRGQTNHQLFSSIERIKGDRQTKDIQQIADKYWDYIIDISCFYPKDLQDVLEQLREKPRKYVFISTCSVYDNEAYKKPLRNESAPILSCSSEQAVDTTLHTYGERKAACEDVLTASGLDHVILRPALVYGQYDGTDRFYYWLHQVKKHKVLLVPEAGQRKFSVTYVHDLVAAIIASIRNKTSSQLFNVVSNPQTSILQIIQEAQKLTTEQHQLIDAPFHFLEENDIAQWSGIPLWLHADYFTYDNSRLLNELNVIPTDLSKSIRDTIVYYDTADWPTPTFGIEEGKKNQLIKKIAHAN